MPAPIIATFLLETLFLFSITSFSQSYQDMVESGWKESAVRAYIDARNAGDTPLKTIEGMDSAPRYSLMMLVKYWKP